MAFRLRAGRRVPSTEGNSSTRLSVWIGAEFVSLLGDQIYFLVLSWLTVQSVGATGTGMVLAAAAVPRALLMVIGGSVADRLGAGRVATYACALRAGALALTGALFFMTEPGIVELAAVAAVFGAVDALFYPASGALPPTLVTADRVVRLQNVRNVVTRVSLVIGAPSGAALLALAGAGPALYVAALGFVASAVAIAALRPIHIRARLSESQPGVLTSAADGLRYVAGDRLLWGGLLAVASFEFSVSGAVNVGYPVMSREHEWGAVGLSLLIAAIGVGAGVTALLLAIHARIRSVAIAGGTGGALCCASMGTLASDPALGVAIAMSGLTGVAGALLAGAVVPTLQTRSEPEFVGRIMALFSLSTLGLAPLSLALAGSVAGAVSTTALMWLTAVFSMFSGLVAVTTARGQALP